jgi:hypothetical protein
MNSKRGFLAQAACRNVMSAPTIEIEQLRRSVFKRSSIEFPLETILLLLLLLSCRKWDEYNPLMHETGFTAWRYGCTGRPQRAREAFFN